MKDYTNVSDISKPETVDAEKSLGPVGQRAMQGSDLPLSIEPTMPLDTSSPDFDRPTASTELGDAMRAETAAEKSEVKHFHNIAPEGIYGEGRGGKG